MGKYKFLKVNAVLNADLLFGTNAKAENAIITQEQTKAKQQGPSRLNKDE